MQTIVNRRRESLAGGHVKGAMVRAHLQYVRDRLGEEALARTLAALPPPVAAEVTGLLVSTWCSFESLIALDLAITRVAGGNAAELVRELGRYSAQINLSTFYRAFHRANPIPAPTACSVWSPMAIWIGNTPVSTGSVGQYRPR